jgi:oxygen-dependent protoporphyrinogen oxidase
MPQYPVGHLDRVRRIRDALPPGIFVVGNALDGVGVSDLARAAEETSARVLAHAGLPRKEPA